MTFNPVSCGIFLFYYYSMKISCVKKINRFINSANVEDIKIIKSKIILSERQGEIFEMYYLKKKNCGFIADSLCVSQSVITKELHSIRGKIICVI